MAKKLLIDIWSDVACPWCYVGKRRLEAALALFPARASVAITWRSFELDPGAPRTLDAPVPLATRLATKYGMPVTEAEAMLRRMTEVGAADGLELRFDRVQPGNTFDAHRILHLAHDRGAQDAVKERLLRAHHTEGARVGDRDTLVRLAVEVGLEEAEVREVLGGDRYAHEVKQDEATARQLGITGVPFFVIGGRYAVSGARPPRAILEALERAWSEAKDEAPAAAEGDVCGPAGCA